MTFIAFLMTFLVGFFIGLPTFLAIAIHMDQRDKKVEAMMKHPSGQDDMPFNILDYSKKN